MSAIIGGSAGGSGGASAGAGGSVGAGGGVGVCAGAPVIYVICVCPPDLPHHHNTTLHHLFHGNFGRLFKNLAS